MRCKNCGCRVYPGKHCTGCGMLQPPRLSRGLKWAVALLSVLVLLLTAAVGFVLAVIEPERRAANAPPVYLATLRDAAAAASGREEAEIAATDAPEDTADVPAAEPATEDAPAEIAAAPEDGEAAAQKTNSAAGTLTEEIAAIRAEYDAIEAKKRAGDCIQLTLRSSVYVYAEEDQPVCIVMRNGADAVSFDRSYYFTDGQLRFAYFEADDALRLYFKNEEMILMRYAEDAYRASNSVDYDATNNEEYSTWCQFAQSEGYMAYAQALELLALREEFIFPDSSTRLLKDAELEGLGAWELRVARNEIYARHGRLFDDAALQAHFDACSWYEGTIPPKQFKERVLSDIEADNVKLIERFEAALE